MKKNSIESMQAELEELDRLEQEAIDQDPFWFFEPSDGTITPEGKALLEKYLKPDDIPQRLVGQLEILLCPADIIGVGGGNQCLGGETKIYDPIKKISRRVDKIDGNFHVYAWDEKKQKQVIAKALKPFIKPEDELYEFTLSNNKKFVASMSHLVLTQKGYLSLTDVLSEGLPILRATTSGTYPLVHDEDDPHCEQKAQDFQFDYQAFRRFCGELLRPLLNIFQGVVPLQGGVRVHSDHAGLSDAQAYMLNNTHFCQSLRHLSSPGAHAHLSVHAFETLSLASGIASKPIYPLRQAFQRFPGVLARLFRPISLFAHSASHSDSLSSSSSTFNAPLSVSSLEVINVTHKRRDVKYDFTVPIYHNYELANCYHHNSGKTTLEIIKGIIKSTGELPDSLIPYKEHFQRDIDRAHKKFIGGRVVAVGETQLHNTVLKWWKYWVPKEYLKNGNWKDSWSAQFNTLTLYRKGKPCAQVEFKTNAQDVETFQGPPLDWLGYDEEPDEAIHKENLMRFTTSDYLDIGFYWTPTKGMSWATDMFLNEDIDESRPIEFFQLSSVTNKKANLKTLDKILSEVNPTRSKEGHDYKIVKMKLLGEVISLSGLIYGKLFDKNLHVIPFFPITKEYTIYRGLDPHLAKPSVCVELAVDRFDNKYVCGSYIKEADTAEIKKDLKQRAKERNYRLAQTRVDRSCDFDIKVLGDRNVFRELSTGENAIPAMQRSEKFTGSIHAGVDLIKQDLRVSEMTGKPKLFILDIPENKTIIGAFRTLERDTYANEEDKGKKDKIKEGKHDTHAALRYIFQKRMPWLAPVESVPEYKPVNEAMNY